MFGFWLGYREKGDKGGEVAIGGYNEDRFTGNITWLPIRQEGFWEVDLDGFSIGDDSHPLLSVRLNDTGAMIDTGTSRIIVPPRVANVSVLNSSFKRVVLERNNWSQAGPAWTLGR
jgi:saccharopepsin